MTTPEEIMRRALVKSKVDGLSDVYIIPAQVKALDAAGYVIVPKELTHEQMTAAFGASAPPPDETPILLDCLDFGGENAARRLIRAVYDAVIAAAQTKEADQPVKD